MTSKGKDIIVFLFFEKKSLLGLREAKQFFFGCQNQSRRMVFKFRRIYEVISILKIFLVGKLNCLENI